MQPLPFRLHPRHATFFFASVTIVLLLTTAVSLSQRFGTQQETLVHSSRMISQVVDRTFESAEELLISLADDFLQDSPPDLHRLQQRMEQAAQFSNHFQRVLLLEGETILLDSHDNVLAGDTLNIHSVDDYRSGIHIGAQLSALPGLDKNALPVYLQLPGRHYESYTLLLTLNPAALRAVYEAFPVSMAGRYGLLQLNGTPLLARTPQQNWVTLSQQMLASDQDSLRQHTGGTLFPAQLSYLQQAERYPLIVARTLDYQCSLEGWTRSSGWLLSLLAFSALFTFISLVIQRQSRCNCTSDTLMGSVHHWRQPLLIVNRKLQVQYSNAAALTDWPGLTEQCQLVPEQEQQTALLAQLEQGRWEGVLTFSDSSGKRQRVLSCIEPQRQDAPEQLLVLLTDCQSSREKSTVTVWPKYPVLR